MSVCFAVQTLADIFGLGKKIIDFISFKARSTAGTHLQRAKLIPDQSSTKPKQAVHFNAI